MPNGFVDPLEEVDHDAEKLALEFERKYGNAYSGGDKGQQNRPTKIHTAADKGSGYDENNGFIDDSEAVSDLFDEIFTFQIGRKICVLKPTACVSVK